MRWSAVRWWRSYRWATPFTFDGIQLVYEQLATPQKRQTELPASHHLILNEKDERVTPTILAVLEGYSEACMGV